MKLVSLLPVFALLVACSAAPVQEPAAPTAPPSPTSATPPPATPAPAAHQDGDGHDHAAPAPTDSQAAAPGGHHEGTASTDLKVPTSVPAIITEIEVRSKKMREQVQAGTLAGVHPLAAEVKKLAITLPTRVTGRSEAEVADITLAATQAKDQANAAHHAADKGDAAAALKAIDGLDAAIARLNKVQR